MELRLCFSKCSFIYQSGRHIGTEHSVPDCEQEAIVGADFRVVQIVGHSATEDVGNQTVRGPPDVMTAVFLQEQRYEDPLVNPQRQWMNGRGKHRVHDHTGGEHRQFKGMNPACRPGKQVELEMVMNLVNVLVQHWNLMVGNVFEIDEEVADYQGSNQVSGQLPQ